MIENNISNTLKKLTLHAFTESVGKRTELKRLLGNIDVAVKTREILGFIQFEAMWQAQRESGDDLYLFTEFKLAPEFLEKALFFDLDADVPLNYLKWQFILPLIDNLSPTPSNVIDYLCLGEVTVDAESDKSYINSYLVDLLKSS